MALWAFVWSFAPYVGWSFAPPGWLKRSFLGWPWLYLAELYLAELCSCLLSAPRTCVLVATLPQTIIRCAHSMLYLSLPLLSYRCRSMLRNRCSLRATHCALRLLVATSCSYVASLLISVRSAHCAYSLRSYLLAHTSLRSVIAIYSLRSIYRCAQYVASLYYYVRSLTISHKCSCSLATCRYAPYSALRAAHKYSLRSYLIARRCAPIALSLRSLQLPCSLAHYLAALHVRSLHYRHYVPHSVLRTAHIILRFAPYSICSSLRSYVY
jgi:hypothetical protein